MTIETELKKYSEIKTDLLNMARCIDSCTRKSEKEFYQDICLVYSNELKSVRRAIEEAYNVKLCRH